MPKLCYYSLPQHPNFLLFVPKSHLSLSGPLILHSIWSLMICSYRSWHDLLWIPQESFSILCIFGLICRKSFLSQTPCLVEWCQTNCTKGLWKINAPLPEENKNVQRAVTMMCLKKMTSFLMRKRNFVCIRINNRTGHIYFYRKRSIKQPSRNIIMNFFHQPGLKRTS